MTTEVPAFSVVLPTHNRAHLLPRAIYSVLAQTFKNYELIVVDDASTDNTAEVITTFTDARLRYVRLPQNRGVSVARNTAIRSAHGQFIAFLDDDDEYLPHFLAETYRRLESAPLCVGYSWCGIQHVRMVDGQTQIIREQTWPLELSTFISGTVRPKPVIGTGFGLTVRRGCFAEVGLFDEGLRSVVDTDFIFRLKTKFDYVVVPQILIRIYQHERSQLTKPSLQRAIDLERVIQNNIHLLNTDTKEWIAMHRKCAELYYYLGSKKRGRKLAWHMLRKKPLRWRSWKSVICFELFGTEKIGIRQWLQLTSSTNKQ